MIRRDVSHIARDIASLAEEVNSVHISLQELDSLKRREFYDTAVEKIESIRERLGNLAIMLGATSPHSNDKMEVARIAIDRVSPSGQRGHFLYRLGDKSSLDVIAVTPIYHPDKVKEFWQDYLPSEGWQPVGINDLFFRLKQ